MSESHQLQSTNRKSSYTDHKRIYEGVGPFLQKRQ